MDTSRRVLQAPAESSASGQIPDISSSTERERLLIELIFASRDMAVRQFSRSLAVGEHGSLRCIECRQVQKPSDFLSHEQSCRTGRVLDVIHKLLATLNSQIPNERSARRENSSEPVSTAVEERPSALPSSDNPRRYELDGGLEDGFRVRLFDGDMDAGGGFFPDYDAAAEFGDSWTGVQ